MLAHLSVNNFAIVKSLQLELSKGMTTITGETGAGKSIAIDALGLCLGGRSDAGMVRQGEEKTEVSAAFLLENNLHATRWLEDNELLDGTECILRRTISKEGRSRAFINGSPVPLSQLKSLGSPQQCRRFFLPCLQKLLLNVQDYKVIWEMGQPRP